MSRLKVLIVDDAISIRESLKKILSSLSSIEVIGEAGSIADAKKILDESKPELTLLDLNLSDGSGIELLKEIKTGENPHTVIILTNFSAPQYKTKSFENGADYFLDKSTEFERVVDLIKLLN